MAPCGSSAVSCTSFTNSIVSAFMPKLSGRQSLSHDIANGARSTSVSGANLTTFTAPASTTPPCTSDRGASGICRNRGNASSYHPRQNIVDYLLQRRNTVGISYLGAY